MKVFIDMDGVLCDFIGAALAVHGLPDPYADPANLGDFGLHGLLGLDEGEFWRPLDNPGFWQNLYPTREARGVLKAVKDAGIAREDMYLLTAPSKADSSYVGKRAWVRRHVAGLLGNFIPTKHKALMAAPGRVLIDDRDKNVDEWEEAGGTGILFPRPWNARHADQDGYDFAAELMDCLHA
jgi:5'(3')-deoxyribonucleotidase